MDRKAERVANIPCWAGTVADFRALVTEAQGAFADERNALTLERDTKVAQYTGSNHPYLTDDELAERHRDAEDRFKRGWEPTYTASVGETGFATGESETGDVSELLERDAADFADFSSIAVHIPGPSMRSRSINIAFNRFGLSFHIRGNPLGWVEGQKSALMQRGRRHRRWWWWLRSGRGVTLAFIIYFFVANFVNFIVMQDSSFLVRLLVSQGLGFAAGALMFQRRIADYILPPFQILKPDTPAAGNKRLAWVGTFLLGIVVTLLVKRFGWTP